MHEQTAFYKNLLVGDKKQAVASRPRSFHFLRRAVPCLDRWHPEAEEFELALMGFLVLSVRKMPACGVVAIMAIGGVMIGP